jgi:hypothetical protein
MKKTLGAIALVLVLIFGFRYWKTPKAAQATEATPTETTIVHMNDTMTVQNESTGKTTLPTTTTKKIESSAEPVFQADEKTILTSRIKSFTTCFGIPMPDIQDDAKNDYESLSEALSQKLGDVNSEVEDWSSVDLVTDKNENRRIVVENRFGPMGFHRIAHYYSIADNGAMTELPLSNDQAQGPSETFLATLESDGQVSSRTKSRRINYDGIEMIVEEKDGKIDALKFASLNGKSFHCDSETSCTCEK